MNALVSISKGVQATKLCSNKLLSWECWPTQVDLYSGRKMVVFVVAIWRLNFYLQSVTYLCFFKFILYITVSLVPYPDTVVHRIAAVTSTQNWFSNLLQKRCFLTSTVILSYSKLN